MQITPQVVRLGDEKARVTCGPYNTTCHIRDIFAVKKQLVNLVAAIKKCPKCGQLVEPAV